MDQLASIWRLRHDTRTAVACLFGWLGAVLAITEFRYQMALVTTTTAMDIFLGHVRR